MYTLFIDTHYKDILLILYKDNSLLDKLFIKDIKSTSIETMPAIIKLLDNNKLSINDINKIAVVKGPGSFTGVRLGVTIAKTLAYTLSIPIVSLTSIDLIGINLDEPKYVSIKEQNGAFICFYDETKEIKYMKKSEYEEFIKNNEVIEELDIDYQKLINYINTLKEEVSHNVNPLYIKSIEALDDKKN